MVSLAVRTYFKLLGTTESNSHGLYCFGSLLDSLDQYHALLSIIKPVVLIWGQNMRLFI